MNIITQVQVTAPPRETHPIIQCINKKKLSKLKQFLKGNNINGLYPCTKCNDYITPLIAAVINHNEDICTFLLNKGADANALSQNGLTALHYVSLFKAPLVFVRMLLVKKPELNVCSFIQPCTPLQYAAINHREDLVKELISAGALVALLPINDAKCMSYNKKISEMIHHIASSGDELCSKIKYFFDMHMAVREKTAEEVFKTFDSHMLEEDPQTHLAMIETLFNVTGRGAEKYRQDCFRWLKDTGNLNSYIERAVSRFPNIPQEFVNQAIISLHAVFCTLEEIQNDQALAIIPQLLKRLCSKERPDVCELVLKNNLCDNTENQRHN